MFIFVTGGHRSGRSNYALRRAAELGPPPWRYVTSGGETDEAVRKRIERQRKDKEAIWQTAVMPPDLRSLLQPPSQAGLGAMVLDSFSGWFAARIATTPADAPHESVLLDDLDDLADSFYRSPVPLLVVSQEMGMGLVPSESDPGAQRLLRLTAAANQILAGMASSVVMLVSGVPLKVR